MTVAVINIGVGNTASVMFALERLGVKGLLTSDAREIAEADRIILPGVGAAAFAMAKIDEAGVRDAITASSRPILGICLGQQILFERSEEGDAPALGLIPGAVKKLAGAPDRPIPHMGWSRICRAQDHPILEGVKDGDYCYFVHSFACPVNEWAIATSDYGERFAAMVAKGAVFGCQFHPERSGAVGARILSNFQAYQC